MHVFDLTEMRQNAVRAHVRGHLWNLREAGLGQRRAKANRNDAQMKRRGEQAEGGEREECRHLTRCVDLGSHPVRTAPRQTQYMHVFELTEMPRHAVRAYNRIHR